MGEILDDEKPDLVVLTGDLVSGYAWDGKTKNWMESKWTEVVQPMVDRGIPWATTAGNHDTEGDLSRKQLSELDRSFNLSLTLPN
jgi:predicted MPP superfamily phosphohydrolase